MGDMGDVFNAMKDARKEQRRLYGQACPECLVKLPKANASILLPQQTCRIHRYRDPRPLSVLDEARGP